MPTEADAVVTVTSYEARVLRMTDDELVEELWKAIGRVADDEDADELYQVAGELLERLAPELDRRSTERSHRSDPHAQAQLASWVEHRQRRAEARAAFASASDRVQVVDSRDLQAIRDA